MYIKTFLLTFSVALCFAFCPSYAVTLNEAVSRTLATHPALTEVYVATDNVIAQRKEAQSAYFPMLSATATGGRIFQNNANSRGLLVTRGEAYSWLWEGSLTARQMLFDGFETQNRTRSAATEKIAAEFTVQDMRETLAFNTVQACIDVARTQTALAMIKKQTAKTTDYLSRIQTGLSDGMADISEVERTQDILSNLDGLRIIYQGQAEAAITQYTDMTGENAPGTMTIMTPESDAFIDDIDAALEMAVNTHPSVHAAMMSVKAAGYDIDAEKAQLYPDINGELSYLKSDKREEIGGELVDGRAVIRASWDFETGMGQSARVSQRKARVLELKSRLEQIKRQVKKGVRLAYAEHDTASDLQDSKKRRTQLAQNLLKTYKTQYEGGIVRVVDLAQADFAHFEQKLSLSDTEYRALMAHYAVLAGMGQLTETVLAVSHSPEDMKE